MPAPNRQSAALLVAGYLADGTGEADVKAILQRAGSFCWVDDSAGQLCERAGARVSLDNEGNIVAERYTVDRHGQTRPPLRELG